MENKYFKRNKKYLAKTIRKPLYNGGEIDHYHALS
jgi:hypothetical protein